MNLPTDRVHDINYSYGWLLLPWFGGWIALTDAKKTVSAVNGYRLRVFRQFHNCRATGVY